MKKLAPLGRFFLAIAMVAFGVQHFVYLDFVTRVFPKLSAWVPGRPFLACVFGAFLVAGGLAIMLGKAARLAALLLGAVILVSFALLHLPLAMANPHNGGLWTNAGKALALSGGSFLVAGSLPANLKLPANWLAKIGRALEKFIPWGRCFLAAFLILGGIQHFIYAEFVATLVPSWIPGHLFWTYFAGVALIAGGVGIIIPMTTRLAASLTAIMIFLWVVLLHIPRALADLHNANETTAVFEALAMTGAAILVAVGPKGKV
ncbi:MAG: DoxX family membrane protein [Acidobacteriota bacterium]